jgi:hypothetical protein
MSQAANTTNTTRRNILAGLAALPAGAAAPAALASSTPDAELIEIGRQHAALQAQIEAAPDDMPQDEYNTLTNALADLEKAATALPLTTVAGLLVLARMARPWVTDQMPGGYHADEMAQALFDKIEAMTAQAA